MFHCGGTVSFAVGQNSEHRVARRFVGTKFQHMFEQSCGIFSAGLVFDLRGTF